MKIISGFQKPDEGRMVVKDEEVELRSVDNAQSLGIDCVYQDLSLGNKLSVYHNMFHKREKLLRPLPLLANRAMKREARAALDQIGVNVPRLAVPLPPLSA